MGPGSIVWINILTLLNIETLDMKIQIASYNVLNIPPFMSNKFFYQSLVVTSHASYTAYSKSIGFAYDGTPKKVMCAYLDIKTLFFFECTLLGVAKQCNIYSYEVLYMPS